LQKWITTDVQVKAINLTRKPD